MIDHHYLTIKYNPFDEKTIWDNFIDYCMGDCGGIHLISGSKLKSLVDKELLKYSARLDRLNMLIEFDSYEDKVEFILKWS